MKELKEADAGKRKLARELLPSLGVPCSQPGVVWRASSKEPCIISTSEIRVEVQGVLDVGTRPRVALGTYTRGEF